MDRLTVEIDGAPFVEWTSCEVTRALKDFAGSFRITCRDASRSAAALPYATPHPAARLRPGPRVVIKAGRDIVLDGWIKTVEPSIEDGHAEVIVSGEDKAGDLVDCSAAPDGPGEFKNVKLEDAARRIAAPFGLSVRADIDTGEPFPRYAIDLGETGLAAIEKGARQRHALVTSDGVGGLVITRAGKNSAPGRLEVPGNALYAGGSFTHEGRHSETIVRGQAEKAAQRRDSWAAPLTPGTAPTAPEAREDGDGSATERERRGTAATGRARDDEITRYRPIVHLARTQADARAAADEADWRMRTARGMSEELRYRVKGYSVDGKLWRVNEMVPVSDAYNGVERDMLISGLTYSCTEDAAETEITVTSKEAYGKGAVGNARTNRKPKGKKAKGGGPLDGTANPL